MLRDPRFFRRIPSDLVSEGVMPYSLIFDFRMSSSDFSEDKKPISALEVVPMMFIIMEDKLTGLNYSNWSKTIHLYLRSIHMANHLDKDLPYG